MVGIRIDKRQTRSASWSQDAVKKSINFEGAGGKARHGPLLFTFTFILFNYLIILIYILLSIQSGKREKGKGKIMGPLPN